MMKKMYKKQSAILKKQDKIISNLLDYQFKEEVMSLHSSNQGEDQPAIKR